MDSNEFNKKYEEYIEEGFEGMEFNIPDVTEYLDIVFGDLIKIPGFKYAQIKLKFGMCRFYADVISAALSTTIEQKIDTLIKNERSKLS